MSNPALFNSYCDEILVARLCWLWQKRNEALETLYHEQIATVMKFLWLDCVGIFIWQLDYNSSVVWCALNHIAVLVHLSLYLSTAHYVNKSWGG